MNAYRFNQIAMAVLFALLLFFGLDVATSEKPKDGKKPAEQPAAAQSEVLGLLATADAAAGEADAGLCKVCHTFDKGGAAIIGPNLYGVLGRKIASVEGFNYTPALKEHTGDWTYEQVDALIHNPQTFAPGTMMASKVSNQPNRLRISKFGIMKMNAGRNRVAMIIPKRRFLSGNSIRAKA